MAITGFLLALFLLVHMAGNIVILVSQEAFNKYAYALTSNKALLFSAEAGLIALLGIHFVASVVLTRRNKKARPQRYEYRENTKKSRRTWASSNMIITGLFILLFLVVHLLNFKFGEEVMIEQDGVLMRDLAYNVIASFQKPLEVAFYVIAMIMIAMHLSHGFRSAFGTLGLETSRTEKILKRISQVYLVVVFGGFIFIPLGIYFLMETGL